MIRGSPGRLNTEGALPATAPVLLCLSLLVGALSGDVQSKSAPPLSTNVSRECLTPDFNIYRPAPLTRTKAALQQKRPVRILAFGSSSTAGVGASSPLMSYPALLEVELESLHSGIEFAVTNLGVPGERAAGTARRIRTVVDGKEPDLLIWQVGTNDGLAHVDPEEFARTLATTIGWLKARQVDVVLLNPQYTPALSRHQRYGQMVQIIERVARETNVSLVRRFEAMQDLAQKNARGADFYLARDQLHLNDLGYHCMAEHAARAITLSLQEIKISQDPDHH